MTEEREDQELELLKNLPGELVSLDYGSQVVFHDIEGKLLHVTTGNDDRPADQVDINDLADVIQKQFEIFGVHCLCVVTNHTVKMNIIEPPSKQHGEHQIGKD